MHTDSDESEFLIEYFKNLILNPENQKPQPVNSHTHVNYVFVYTDKKFDYKSWGCEYFGQEAKITVFRRTNKYTILKLLSHQAYFNNFRHQNMNCCIKPTFHISATLMNQISVDSVNEHIANTERQIYILGRGCKEPENEQLEYKSYRAEILINNTEQIMKIICSMLNSQKQCKILIGISYDKDLNSYVVSGCFCKERKATQIIRLILSKCKEIGCEKQVAIQMHDCGVILNDTCYLVSHLKIFEISLNDTSNKLITITPGKYFIRQSCNSVPIKMGQLYGYLKKDMITENQFEQCLTYYDELMKKNKLI